jgi:hypothetical protein
MTGGEAGTANGAERAGGERVPSREAGSPPASPEPALDTATFPSPSHAPDMPDENAGRTGGRHRSADRKPTATPAIDFGRITDRRRPSGHRSGAPGQGRFSCRGRPEDGPSDAPDPHIGTRRLPACAPGVGLPHARRVRSPPSVNCRAQQLPCGAATRRCSGDVSRGTPPLPHDAADRDPGKYELVRRGERAGRRRPARLPHPVEKRDGQSARRPRSAGYPDGRIPGRRPAHRAGSVSPRGV